MAKMIRKDLFLWQLLAQNFPSPRAVVLQAPKHFNNQVKVVSSLFYTAAPWIHLLQERNFGGKKIWWKQNLAELVGI